MRNGKTVGPDEIFTEIVKLIKEECLQYFTDLNNMIYTIDKIPLEWLEIKCIIMSNKNTMRGADSERDIEQGISDAQFKFINPLETKTTLFVKNGLLQRCIHVYA